MPLRTDILQITVVGCSVKNNVGRLVGRLVLIKIIIIIIIIITVK